MSSDRAREAAERRWCDFKQCRAEIGNHDPSIAEFVVGEVAAAMEECCKAVCPDCTAGMALDENMYHVMKEGGMRFQVGLCKAAAIYILQLHIPGRTLRDTTLEDSKG